MGTGMDWDPDKCRAFHVLRNSETAVPRKDGERLAVTCPPEQEVLRETRGRGGSRISPGPETASCWS